MRKLITMLTAAGILATSALPAFAVPILRLTSGAEQVTVQDNSALDLSTKAGAVSYVGSVGDFSMTATVGATRPILGDQIGAQMDLNSLSITSDSTGTLRMEFTETGFLTTASMTHFISEIGGVVLNALGSNIVFNIFADAGNTAFGSGTLIHSATFGPGAFSTTFGNTLNLTSPYSLTIVADLYHAGSGSSSFNSIVRVPEPAMAALLGIGLLGIGMTKRRRPKLSNQPSCV